MSSITFLIMRKTFKYWGLVIAAIALVSCNGKNRDQAPVKEESFVNDPVSYVNPFLGTAPLTDPDFIGYTPPKD